MTGPSLSTSPSIEEIAAIECPLQRALAITEVARRCGTLPPELSQLRRASLAEARAGRSAGAVALRVGISRARVFQLTRRALVTPPDTKTAPDRCVSTDQGPWSSPPQKGRNP